jgi:hypothetical protein
MTTTGLPYLLTQNARTRRRIPTELAPIDLPPVPTQRWLDRLLWPVMRRRATIALVPLSAGLLLIAALALARSLDVDPKDTLLLSAAGGALCVLWVMITVESHGRMVSRTTRIIERKNVLFRAHLVQSRDGTTATNHVDGGECRCEHITVAGNDLLVTVRPCKRVVW